MKQEKNKKIDNKKNTKNKKNKIYLIPIGLIAIIVVVCTIIYFNSPSSKIRGKGTTPLENPSEVVIRIKKNKKCIPVSLSLYADGTYELFTDYADCRPFQVCTLKLVYTKSIKGTYNYDLTKILDNSIDKEDVLFDDNQIDYEIYTNSSGISFILGEEYDHDYVTKKSETNEPLEELLKEIDVDLDICAISDYN